MGINAAVTGILISAFYVPLAAILFSMLAYWKLPLWMIVVSGAIGGLLISLL